MARSCSDVCILANDPDQLERYGNVITHGSCDDDSCQCACHDDDRRFCNACGADILGNDPHGEGCPDEASGNVRLVRDLTGYDL